MENKLEHLSINFREKNGDSIETYHINNILSALIPNVGEMVSLGGSYRTVIDRSFMYSPKTIIVTIVLDE